jgi:hypothetical protein
MFQGPQLAFNVRLLFDSDYAAKLQGYLVLHLQKISELDIVLDDFVPLAL